MSTDELLTHAAEFELLRSSNPAIARAYQVKRAMYDDGSEGPLDVLIPREEGDYIYSLVRHLRPCRTLEVGMANGLSTSFIADAIRDNGTGRHIAIDPFQFSDWRGAGVTLLRQASLHDLVEVIARPSYQALPDMEENGVTVQFAFIDGSHLFDYVITDCLLVDKILDVGGLIAFDDSDWPSVQMAIRFMVLNRHYRVAFPEVVIEPPPGRPSRISEVMRFVGQRLPALGAKLSRELIVPSHRLRISGRCVVIRKLADDDRDSQVNSFTSL